MVTAGMPLPTPRLASFKLGGRRQEHLAGQFSAPVPNPAHKLTRPLSVNPSLLASPGRRGRGRVPERTHAILRQRAAAAHQSLQGVLAEPAIEDADEPSLEEVLDRAGGRSGGSVPLEDAVAAIRDDRDRR